MKKNPVNSQQLATTFTKKQMMMNIAQEVKKYNTMKNKLLTEDDTLLDERSMLR